MKVPKVVEPTNKKQLLYNFGDYCNKQSNVHSLPEVTFNCAEIDKIWQGFAINLLYLSPIQISQLSRSGRDKSKGYCI